MNTEHFAYFGLRLLEILSLEHALAIAKSDCIAVLYGLLRTHDYETIVQCLSFIKVMALNCCNQEDPVKSMGISEIVQPKLLLLVLRTVEKQPELEFINALADIVNLSVGDKKLREVIVGSKLREDEQGLAVDYAKFLRKVEVQPEIKAIKDLHKKVGRQVKELEVWVNAK